jgi:hypothetical protein
VESLTKELRFVGLWREVAEFVLRHLPVVVVRLTRAIADPQKQLVEENGEICLSTVLDERGRDKQNLQMQAMRGVIGEVEHNPKHERRKVLGLQHAMAEIGRQIKGAAIKLAQPEE